MTRPALELLFARAQQGQTFLLLAAGGVLLGLLLDGAGALHRWNPLAGGAADALCACLGAGMVLAAAFLAGEGLRGYALLGLMLGVALYFAGIHPLAAGLLRLGQKIFTGRQE